MAENDNLPVIAPDASANVPAEQQPAQQPAHAKPEGNWNSPAVIDWAFEVMTAWDNPAAGYTPSKDLRRRWNSDAGQNLVYFNAFAQQHSDVDRLLARAGFSDHPSIVEAGAILARRYAIKGGDPATIPRETSASLAAI